MKVLIFYAAYGGGHLNAAKSITEYIESNYKSVDVELIDCMKYVNKTVEKITSVAYREAAKKVPWVWGRIYSDSQKGALAHLTSRSNKIMAIKLLKLLREKQPDLIISTHPFGSQMCNYLKRKKKITAKIATVMTDFAPHDQWLVGHEYTDYFFVANNNMKQSLVHKEIPKSKIFVTGIPISIRFSQEHKREEILKHNHLEDNKLTILFFGGGEFGLGKTKTVKIFESFVKLRLPIQIIGIAGRNPKMKEAFDEIVQKYNKKDSVKILKYTTQVPELMSISDLVVTKPGGLTTSESLASHLPMVVINPIPGQEEENAEFLEKHGIAVWLKKSDNSDKIVKQLLSNLNQLKDMKENTKALAKPNSTKEICDILLKN